MPFALPPWLLLGLLWHLLKLLLYHPHLHVLPIQPLLFLLVLSPPRLRMLPDLQLYNQLQGL